MERVGIRQLKENLGRYMKKIRIGETFILTDRKQDIAIITPLVGENDEEKLYQLIQRGAASWSGSKPKGMRKRGKTTGKNVSSAVMEDRR